MQGKCGAAVAKPGVQAGYMLAFTAGIVNAVIDGLRADALKLRHFRDGLTSDEKPV